MKPHVRVQASNPLEPRSVTIDLSDLGHHLAQWYANEAAMWRSLGVHPAGKLGADSYMFLSVLFSARIFKHGRQHTQMLECRHRFLRAGICMPGCGHRFPRAGIQILERGQHFLRAGICMPFCGHRFPGAGIQMLE